MEKKQEIFNFTNRELCEIAEEYAKLKMKRDFTIINKTCKKRQDIACVELVMQVKDQKEREYNFKFLFADYYFDCYACGGMTNIPDKTNTNDSFELMEFVAYNYALVTGVAFVDEFREYQYKRFDAAFNEQKRDAKNMEEIKYAKISLAKNKETITGICSKVLQKININV